MRGAYLDLKPINFYKSLTFNNYKAFPLAPNTIQKQARYPHLRISRWRPSQKRSHERKHLKVKSLKLVTSVFCCSRKPKSAAPIDVRVYTHLLAAICSCKEPACHRPRKSLYKDKIRPYCPYKSSSLSLRIH